MKTLVPLVLAFFLLLSLISCAQPSGVSSEVSAEIKNTIETFFNHEYQSLLRGKFDHSKISEDVTLTKNIEHDFSGFLKNKKKIFTNVEINYNYLDFSMEKNQAQVVVEYNGVISYQLKGYEQIETTGFYNIHELIMEKKDGSWFIISNKDLSTNPAIDDSKYKKQNNSTMEYAYTY